ncbi:MFS transporter [Pantoea sp. EABMAA-21]|jgi:MFS transporter, ACS family, D-galactonate transporter|uniref:MFS transporter n=1 Tax=unclassified Pantoea TaxID=2630326 RepID=UPI000BD7015E|nr:MULTISPECIES: MFS transporter [unclassified Pantoea]MDI9280268.1 MFS transporter [Pantoea sp. EABMAA-21]MXP55139.1 MFS transporter [Pantoea sp. Seng]MXP57712.1 MFS transporter [Pantoea sp. Taur]SNY73815.1 MFS transporter, ACS family, D-galactonate transporter [Pantoea sp. GL120224-02]
MTAKPTRTRFSVLAMLFVVTAINYMDRANLSVAGSHIQGDLALSPTQLGLLFSMFTWFYAMSQIPVGYLLDRIGSRWLYGSAIVLWSVFTLLMGFASHHLFATATASFMMLLACRALVGIAEAPSFPSNTKIIATWFPDHERARATATYSSAQYIGLALLTPLLSLIVSKWGWEMSFYISGAVGIVFGFYWLIRYRDPQHSTQVNKGELDIIRQGGGYGSEVKGANTRVNWPEVRFILRQRTTWGLFIAQFAASSTLYFFLTWFIVYLEKGLHLSIDKAGIGAMFPYLMAMAGVLCGGTLSDLLLKRGRSRTFARKLPVMTGMLLTCSIALVNFFQDQPVIAIGILSIAFFANAFSNLGWVVCSDVIPRHLIGTIGGFLNIFGNLSGIASPIIIGIILQRTQNFQYAMWYIAAVALAGFLAYLFLVGKIEVMVPPEEQPTPRDKEKYKTPSNA